MLLMCMCDISSYQDDVCEIQFLYIIHSIFFLMHLEENLFKKK